MDFFHGGAFPEHVFRPVTFMVRSQWRRQDFFSRGARSLSSLPSVYPPLPFPSLPLLYPFPPFPSPQNEEADRSSAPPLSSPPLPSCPLSFPPLRSRPPEIQLGGLGDRCKLPQRGLGWSPSRNRFWCILALKSGIW